MPQGENTVRLVIYMSREAAGRVNDVAKSRGFKSTADYVRDTIASDFQAHGDDLDFDLATWGRYSSDTSPGDEAEKPPKKTKKKSAT
jgi:hypothetical protein